MTAASDAPGKTAGVKVAVIAGPTASGKSGLALKLAREFNAEIISADSRQIYHQLKIGTDRLDKADQQGIPHHLMGTVDLGQRFTAFDFVREAVSIIRDINARGKKTIICGGTGLYIRALIDGIFEIPDDDMSYRNYLIDLAAREGSLYLHRQLSEIDPEEAGQIHPQNSVRIIRALEIYHITGKTKTELMKQTRPVADDLYYRQIILMPLRENLYKRIEARVDQMIKAGLEAEVRSVYNSEAGPVLKEARILGYSELISYFEGDISRDEAIRLIKQNTRHYAKRQFTWFRAVKQAEVITRPGIENYDDCRLILQNFWAGDKWQKT